MKAVILAAGYGTRLQRDVLADSSGRFDHLRGAAKPLLPVGGRALVSHWVRAVSAAGGGDGGASVYVVVSPDSSESCVTKYITETNALYHAAFEEWASHFPNVKVLNDQTTSNEGRLGAVACLQLAVQHFQIDDHIIVIGGDTLFKEDFSLGEVKQRFSDLQSKCEDSCLVLSYQCKDEETHKYGILEVDSDLRALCMKEKPLPSETESRRAKSLPLLNAFMEEKKDTPIAEKDAPGNFVSWLIPRKPVYVHQISGRFDVGNLSSYVECDLYFKEKLQDAESYMV